MSAKKSLHELKKAVSKIPQKMLNVRTNAETDIASLPDVQEAVSSARAQLGEGGRILIRPSGTEPLIRIMVEGNLNEEVERIAGMLAKKIESIVQSSFAT